jgi:hypothetical protein
MKTINKIWAFLDQKKTAIGMGILITANVMKMAAPAVPVVMTLVPILEYVGTAIGGVGILHKGMKARAK